jgi:hypothetical protein
MLNFRNKWSATNKSINLEFTMKTASRDWTRTSNQCSNLGQEKSLPGAHLSILPELGVPRLRLGELVLAEPDRFCRCLLLGIKQLRGNLQKASRCCGTWRLIFRAGTFTTWLVVCTSARAGRVYTQSMMLHWLRVLLDWCRKASATRPDRHGRIAF